MTPRTADKPATRPPSARTRQRNDAKEALHRVKASRAVMLRLLGQTFQQIADGPMPCVQHEPAGRASCKACLPRLYDSRQSAHRAVQHELSARYGEGAEAREELRRHQLGQIDLLLATAMRSATNPGTPERPNAGQWTAMLRATQLLDRRARLLGLDAPVRIVGQVTTEWESEISALVEQITRLPGPGRPETHPG